MKVEILRLGPTLDREPLGAVGDVVEVSDDFARALVKFAYVKPFEADTDEADEATDDNDADDNDKGTKPGK